MLVAIATPLLRGDLIMVRRRRSVATRLPGMLVAARAWWRVPVDRRAGFGCLRAKTTGTLGGVRGHNRAFLQTVGWTSVAG